MVGRLVLVRPMGKASFAHIEDGTSRLQIYLKKEEVGEETYEMFLKDLDLGDFVEAQGHMFRTKTGEPTLRVAQLRIISKAIHAAAGKMARPERCGNALRQRYADLLSNPETREVFRKRTKVVNALRRFFDNLDFLEVETPILQPLYGGAAARPFITHHNQLDQDLYLRISFELYLKRLLVGMYERVYEIGRDFRNEGVSFKHNPEFTQLEFYAAYWDYQQGDGSHRADGCICGAGSERHHGDRVRRQDDRTGRHVAAPDDARSDQEVGRDRLRGLSHRR